MRKINILLIYLIIYLLFSCSSNHTETIIIKDASISKNYKIDFDISLESKNVDNIRINIKGNLKDTAKIGSYYLLPGEVDTSFTHEWYSSDYLIEYNSYTKNAGQLSVKVDFTIF